MAKSGGSLDKATSWVLFSAGKILGRAHATSAPCIRQNLTELADTHSSSLELKSAVQLC